MNEGAASASSEEEKSARSSASIEHAPEAPRSRDVPDAAAPPPPPRPEARGAPARGPARDATARAAAGLAILAALGAAALGAWNYYRPNVPPPDLSGVETALGTARSALGDAQTSMARLDADIADMRGRIDELAAAQTAAARDIETLRNQTLETVDALRRVASGDAFTSHRWIRAEAEHLMQSANIALQLNHDPATALAALEAADERLAELADPAFTGARARLAEEIAALRALPRPDIEGAALTLGSLAARVELLPVPEAAPPAEATAPQNGWDRAVARVRAALTSLISVRRTTDGGVPVLPPEERYFLYRNLELELESARLAALQGDGANYKQSLDAARRWLETRFVQDDPGVRSALAALAELASIELATSWPDISGSLDELRRAASQ